MERLNKREMQGIGGVDGLMGAWM